MFGNRRNKDDEDKGGKGPRGSRSVNQNAVYFECNVCSHRFQEDPNQDFIDCPQCGSDDTGRV